MRVTPAGSSDVDRHNGYSAICEQLASRCANQRVTLRVQQVRVGPVPSISKLAGVKRDFQHTVAWPTEIQKPEGFLTQALNDRPGPPPGTMSPIPPVLPTAPFSSRELNSPDIGHFRRNVASGC